MPAASARRAAVAFARCCLMYRVWTKSGTLSFELFARSLWRLRASFLMVRVRACFSAFSTRRCSCIWAILVFPLSRPVAADVSWRMASTESGASLPVASPRASASPAGGLAGAAPVGVLPSASAIPLGGPWEQDVV